MASEKNGRAGKSMRPLQRRNPLLRAQFQLKYAFWSVLATMIGSTLIGSFAFVLLHQQARARVLHVVDPAAVSTIDTTWSLVGYTAGMALLLGSIVGFWVVRVTHRVVGPLWVIEQSFNELAAGRWPTRRPLRKNDELKDFHAAFWQALDALHARRSDDLERLRQARQDARTVLEGDSSRTRQAAVCVAGALDDLYRSTAESIGEPTAPNVEPPAKTGTQATSQMTGCA